MCVRLRQINHSFTGVCVCVCVVSSHGSLGAQDKQCEVGYKVGPLTHSFVHEEIPPRRCGRPGNGVRSQPHSNTGV